MDPPGVGHEFLRRFAPKNSRPRLAPPRNTGVELRPSTPVVPYTNIVAACFACASCFCGPTGSRTRDSAMRMPRNTTLLWAPCSLSIGLLGIEPSLHAPEACVLPVYYSPSRRTGCTLQDSNLRPLPCEGNALPTELRVLGTPPYYPKRDALKTPMQCRVFV